MNEKVFWITGIYFVIGALLLARITTRHTEKQKMYESWIKYLVYLVIVGGMIALILTQTLAYASAGLSVLALYEVFNITIKQQQMGNRHLLAAFPFLFFMIYCFLWLAYRVPPGMQLYVYTIVFSFDGFSQLTGQLLGRHRLAPVLSPGKTIEGAIGGFLLAGLTAFVLVPANWETTVPFWTGVCAFAMGGDLFASFCKRVLKVKDYSNLIPGHGGVLDRFDSLFGASVFLYGLDGFIPVTL